MRRNNMGRGRGRGQGDRGSAWGGPLIIERNMTISNLNKELEVLRRKREVIRREQEVLDMENQFHRKRQYESHHDFSNMYGNVWESSPPKRFNDFPPVKPWMEGAGPDCPRPLLENPGDSNYIPPFNNPPYNQGRMRPLIKPQLKPIVHPILKQGLGPRGPRPTPNLRSDFKPTKIIKNRPQAPNNLRSYPVAERKNYIKKAIATQGSSNQKSANAADRLTLREDQQPSQQMTGRLELALGSLVKEIKTTFTKNVEFSNLIENSSYQRIMKQAIRERIRKAMIGHRVGPISDIVAKYREMFPKDTDKELVDLVLNAKDTKKATVVVDSDDPEEFFKTNISGIIEKKMEEMFANLVKMYSNNTHRKPSLAYAQTSNDEKKADESTKKDTSKIEDATKVIKTFAGHKITLGEKKMLNDFYTELIENILEEKIPEALPKCMKHITKILDIDHQYKSIKFMTFKRIRDMERGKKSVVTGVENSPKKEDTNQEKESNEQTATDNEEASKQDMKEEEENENKEASNQDMKEENENKEASNQDMKGEENENMTVGETEQNDSSEKQEETLNTSVENSTSNDTKLTEPTTPATATKPKDNVATETPKTPATPSLELPYYVKLFGRPRLPTRAAIHDFLKEYRPVSIKKHKSINNLLVVGFSNEEDYNKIVTASETVLGNITIIIKASEKATGKENDSTSNGNETQKKETEDVKESSPQVSKCELDEQISDLLAPKGELDEQINDLLSSIRQADEGNEQSENTTNGAVENTDTEMAASENKTEKTPLEPVPEAAEGDAQECAKDKGPVANVKESGRATPVRASSRLANVTPSSIRTRRASRLMQE